jgi:isocitrate lyase
MRSATNGHRRDPGDALRHHWEHDPRWAGIHRDYRPEDVLRLRGTVHVEHTLARRGAERLWRQLHEEPYINALGAVTGNQAVQMVRAGLQAIYLSGWQVAGDANLGEQTYPDQSLYPANSAPALVRRINNALLRADQIAGVERERGASQGRDGQIDWLVPIVADGEAEVLRLRASAMEQCSKDCQLRFLREFLRALMGRLGK